MPELWTEDPRLASVYDAECVGREDHDFYLAVAEELAARSIVDVGCGTGVFAVDAARRGHLVTGVDPALAMLGLARDRAGADLVSWIHGTADDVPSRAADLVIMMGHVAQYFVDDADWAAVLGQIRRVLRPGGHLAFETRNPAVDWRARWTRTHTLATYQHPDGGDFTSWVEVVEVSGQADSYTTTHRGHTLLPGGEHLVADETLRFRSATEVIESLVVSGFVVDRVWGDWKRSPFEAASDELVVLAVRP